MSEIAGDVRTPRDQGDGLDVAHFARELKRNRRWLLGAAVVVTLIALPFDLLRDKLYQAEVALMSLERGEETTPVDAFRTFLFNDSVSTEVFKKHRLHEPPESLTMREYKQRRLSIDADRATGVLYVKFRATSPDLAAAVANSHAAAGVELHRRINEADLVRVRGQLADQVSETSRKLTEVAQELQAFRQKAQIEMIRSDVATGIRQRSEAQQLEVEIAGLRAKAAAAEHALSKRAQTLDLLRSLSPDSMVVEAFRPQGAPGLKLQTEEVNDVYQKIDEMAVKARADLQSAEQRYRMAIAREGVMSARNPKLMQLQALEIELARRTGEFEIAQAANRDAELRYAEVKTTAASRPLLQVVDPALPPDRPQPRYPGLPAVAAGLAVLALCAVGLFLREFGRLLMRD